MDRGAWQATVYGVAKSQTRLSHTQRLLTLFSLCAILANFQKASFLLTYLWGKRRDKTCSCIWASALLPVDVHQVLPCVLQCLYHSLRVDSEQLTAGLVLSVPHLFCLPSPSGYFEANPRCRINSVCIMSVCISIKDMSFNSPFSWRLSFHICFLGICLLKHLFVRWRFQVCILLFQLGGVI